MMLQCWIILIFILPTCFVTSRTISSSGIEEFMGYEPENQSGNRDRWMNRVKTSHHRLQTPDSEEIDTSNRADEDNIHKQEKTISTTLKIETKPSLDNRTKDILQWLNNQFNQSDHHQTDVYGDCFAYINTSTLETLLGYQSDNQMSLKFNDRFKTSCDNPCNNFNQTLKYDPKPLVQDSCPSAIVMNIKGDEDYTKKCIPQLRVDINKPRIIRAKVYWCLYILMLESTQNTNKHYVQKHVLGDDEKRNEKFVLPHRGHRFHDKWSSLAQKCPNIDVRVDQKYFCEVNEHDRIPESPRITDLDNDAQQSFLNEMIDHIIDHDRIVSHYRFHHCDAFSFFYGHRRFLNCVKQLLAKKSLALPIWSPDIQQAIPSVLQVVKYSPYACLGAPYCSQGWSDVPFERTQIDVALLDDLREENICQHDFFTLHRATLEYHRLVHNQIGGAFRTFDSPASPLFYVFHNFIDEKILKVWERCSDANKHFFERQTL